MINTNFNPLLIHALTNKPVEEIATSPSITDLPGELAQLVATNIDLAPRRFPKNDMFLICKSCRKRARYDVGAISVNLDSVESASKNPLEDCIQYTGYFRCKKCNSAGKWSVVANFRMRIMTQVAQASISLEEDILFNFGKNQLFDGSEHQYSTDSEEYLLNKISKAPTNALLWNKLGNLYYAGGRADLSVAAYEHSISLDKMQTESYYSLGMILANISPEKSIRFYHKMMVSALHYYDIDALKLRELIAAALNGIFQLHIDTQEKLVLTPEMDVYEELEVELPKPEKGQPTTFEGDIELDYLESFYPIAEVFMGERRKELRKRRK